MKKAIKVWILLMVTAFGASSLFAQQGLIRKVAGKVEISNDGGKSFKAALSGMSVQGNTVIWTQFGAEATLTLGNSEIQVKPLTKLTVEELSKKGSGKETTTVSLAQGTMKVNVDGKSKKVDFTAKSPNATASVRGTEFEMETNGKRTTLSVIDGTVDFKGRSGKTITVIGKSGMEPMRAQANDSGDVNFITNVAGSNVSAPPPKEPPSGEGGVPQEKPLEKTQRKPGTGNVPVGY